MQHPAAPSVPRRRRRPTRSRRGAHVLLRRLPKRRSLLQLLKRGSSNRGDNSRQQKAAMATAGDGDREKEEMEMEMVNMKLYLENRCIMEENQRLRKKALALRHENQILLTQLHHHHHGFQFAVADVSSAAGEQLPAHHH